MADKYILTSVIDKDSKNAGPKAKYDIDLILEQQGYQKLDLHLPTSRIQKIEYVLFKLKQVFKTKKAAQEIVFQYPIYSMFLTKQIIKTIRRYTQAKIYFIIHDIETLRGEQGNQRFARDERYVFNQVDGLIVHNQKMQNWLKDQGITTKMVNLNLFDYLNEQPIYEKTTYQASICYAGNLQKANFLKKLQFQQVNCYLFGNQQADSYPAKIVYQGAYHPDELPKYLTQNFGLIWDGDSLQTCTGLFGEYTKYNAPHKTSLYLSCGMPVIVWSQAGIAPFIEENQVGLVIDDLTKLEEVLTNLSIQDYIVLKQNALQIAKKLRAGYFITTALAKLQSR